MVVKLNEFFSSPTLISRESARALQDLVRSGGNDSHTCPQANASDMGDTISFEGIRGIAPSFIDELIRIVISLRNEAGCDLGIGYRLRLVHMPTRLSSKYLAIARSHQLDLKEVEDRVWEFTPIPT